MLITGVRFKRHWDPKTRAGKAWAVSELKRLHSLALSEPLERLEGIWVTVDEIKFVFNDRLVYQWAHWTEEVIDERTAQAYA